MTIATPKIYKLLDEGDKPVNRLVSRFTENNGIDTVIFTQGTHLSNVCTAVTNCLCDHLMFILVVISSNALQLIK